VKKGKMVKWDGYKRWTTKELKERLIDLEFYRNWMAVKGRSTRFYDEQIAAIEKILKDRGVE